jgi:prefoldin beta subunit
MKMKSTRLTRCQKVYPPPNPIDITKIRENVQQYEHKKSENEMVRNELNFLEEGDVIYKLVGPILVKQQHDEAKMNVDKRVEFIGKEM